MHPNWPVFYRLVGISVIWLIIYFSYWFRRDIWPHVVRCAVITIWIIFYHSYLLMEKLRPRVVKYAKTANRERKVVAKDISRILDSTLKERKDESFEPEELTAEGRYFKGTIISRSIWTGREHSRDHQINADEVQYPGESSWW